MDLIHARQSSSPDWTLDDYRSQIIREIDGVALRVGMLLREAKLRSPDHFNQWVERDLPFGLETARRMMGISQAYEKLPPEKLRLLPRPWQAMYALKALDPRQLAAGMASGDINPDMTVKAARRYASQMRDYRPDLLGPLGAGTRVTRADMAAGMLMQFGPHELTPSVLGVLSRWLARGAVPASEDPENT